jgi:benzoyl-CoA reductase subunit D
MTVAGIDVGAKNIKIVLYADGKVLARGLEPAGMDAKSALEKVFARTLAKGGVERESLGQIIATGAGRKDVAFADGQITEVSAAAKAASMLFPSCRTVIDVGAEEGRAMRCDDKGKVIDFEVNEKCAAGAGTFTEAMARALEVSLEELGKLSLESKNSVPMNAQCAVFAESEVVSLIHQQTPKADIARAVHDAIASRIISMVRKIGFEPDVVLIGGVAKNPGFLDSLSRDLETDIAVPEHPEYICALGAALAAAEA